MSDCEGGDFIVAFLYLMGIICLGNHNRIIIMGEYGGKNSIFIHMFAFKTLFYIIYKLFTIFFLLF